MREINSLNKVLLIGNLGGNPEMRRLAQQDRSVARFNIATKERLYNPNSRETSERTEWHRIVVWGKLAEFCEKYLTKGRQVLVEGKLRTRDWQDREGNKRRTTEVEALNIVLLGRREEAAPVPDTTDFGTQGFGGSGGGTGEDEFPQPEEGGQGEDDVPF